jgi:hypothetical protein
MNSSAVCKRKKTLARQQQYSYAREERIRYRAVINDRKSKK